MANIVLTTIPIITEDCTIIGCNDAKLINKAHSSDFFYIKQGKKLTIQDIILVTDETSATIDNDIWINDNISGLIGTVALPSVDYGVFLEDVETANTFIKNIKLEGHKITYTEYDWDEFNTLNDTKGIITDLNIDGHSLTYKEYSPVTTDTRLLGLKYIYLDDRLELINAIETLTLDNHTLISTEYKDEIAYQIGYQCITTETTQ